MEKIGLTITRISLVILCYLAGTYIGPELFSSPYSPIWGGIGGGLVASAVILLEISIKRASGKGIIGGIIGLMMAFFLTHLAAKIFFPPSWKETHIYPLLYTLTGYMGIMIGVRKVKGVNPATWRILSKTSPQGEMPKILDTSVIIDGRIADVCETGFVEGPFIIPQFVLRELQHIADSPDPLKRNRGRRGLDILNKMQKQNDVEVRISDQDFLKLKEVDAKLVELAKKMNGRIITNDYNLNKVAELQGLIVLNINQLSNALKPVVLPGETIHVQILKEGKETGQGVAYLDDGTMVVVEEGKKIIGKELDVVVTSVLQTTAGRMIFARPREEDFISLEPSLRAGRMHG
ncbi:MAG: TRAM domain-containing protein [Deltaproteobacteria bacterium]|nr:TRAM domain-containing protein [Deltaproteobacteria bacterium]